MTSITARLGIMMFFQYAIWGCWGPVLSQYLLDLGYSGMQAGMVLSLLPLATIVSPFAGGQLADRHIPAERVVGGLHLAGGLLLFFAARITELRGLSVLMLLYSLCYAPTLALTNAIAFTHLTHREREFGRIRVWGTIGWIAAGLTLSGWRMATQAAGHEVLPGDLLVLAGWFSLAMGVYSFMLPVTPPNRTGTRPWAFIEAFRMLGDPAFALFIGIAFVASTQMMFYFNLTAPFLASPGMGLDSAVIPGVMVVAQLSEFVVMALLLPYSIRRIGLTYTMTLGLLAWPLRYLVFALGGPFWLVIASLGLHGFCYVFFFTAAFIYVDRTAPNDIRASAQGLFSIVTMGAGNFLGSLFAGWIHTTFTDQSVTDWRAVFIVPVILTAAAMLIFLLRFRDTRQSTT